MNLQSAEYIYLPPVDVREHRVAFSRLLRPVDDDDMTYIPWQALYRLSFEK